MTGYGRGDFSVDKSSYTVEVRSLNNRFLDARIKTPERLIPLDTKIRDEIKNRFSRGSFSVYISLASEGKPEVKINMALARAYAHAAAELKKDLTLPGEVDLELLFRLKDIFYSEKSSPDQEADWKALKGGLVTAFDQLEEWRIKEGMSLSEDIHARLAALEGFLGDIEKRAPFYVESYRKRLTEELAKVLSNVVDPARVVQEAAIIADRTDISEELTRLRSHMAMFRNYLDLEEPVGKRMDFLCQEILREANTIGSKSNDVEIIQAVVEVKGLLEKIREQVQNVE